MGKGWCLSNDWNDGNGKWRDYLTSEDACYRQINFKVGSDRWTAFY